MSNLEASVLLILFYWSLGQVNAEKLHHFAMYHFLCRFLHITASIPTHTKY